MKAGLKKLPLWRADFDYFRIISKADLPASAKLVLLYILHPSYRDMSHKHHCDRLVMSERTFSNCIGFLLTRGYLLRKCMGRGNGSFDRHYLTDKAIDLFQGSFAVDDRTGVEKRIVNMLRDVIRRLMILNPAEGTPACDLLAALGSAVDAYERRLYPDLTNVTGTDLDYPN